MPAAEKSNTGNVAQSREAEGMLKGAKQYRGKKSVPVIIADDEPNVLKILENSLAQIDSRVSIYQAYNGRETLQKIEEVRENYNRDPALIVLDLRMPVMDGWETIKTLKKEYENAGKSEGIPLVVYSGTSGKKGLGVLGANIHKDGLGYKPLIRVAKDDCVAISKYDAQGHSGLEAWIRHFMKPRISKPGKG